MRCGIPADGLSVWADLGSMNQGGAERGSQKCAVFSLGPPSRAPLLDFSNEVGANLAIFDAISSRHQALVNQLRRSGVEAERAAEVEWRWRANGFWTTVTIASSNSVGCEIC